MLEVRNLEVSYGRIRAVRGVSLAVSPGQVVGIIGTNGAGKSSILGALSGIIAARGTATMEGITVLGRAPEDIVRMGIAIVPENRRMFANLSVLEHLRLGATIRKDRAAIADDIDRLLERFGGLRRHLKSRATSLSGGEQQQLAIARALLSRPRLLLMDEPSLGLAPVLVDVVFEVIGELKAQGIAILLAEQYVARTLQAADYIYALDRGVVTIEGDPATVEQSVDFRHRYLSGLPSGEVSGP